MILLLLAAPSIIIIIDVLVDVPRMNTRLLRALCAETLSIWTFLCVRIILALVHFGKIEIKIWY